MMLLDEAFHDFAVPSDLMLCLLFITFYTQNNTFNTNDMNLRYFNSALDNLCRNIFCTACRLGISMRKQY